MADNCIHCQHPVRAKQQGIQCDGCLKWNHRTCNTGISQQQYRAAVRAGAEILWFCPPCRPDPVAESSRVSGEFDIFDQSNYILESEEFNPPRKSFDTEGWHHGLNCRAQGKSQLPFYLLVELLFQEAKLTSLQIRLVSDKKLKRIQRKEYRNVQARLFEAWDKYQNGDISVERL